CTLGNRSFKTTTDARLFDSVLPREKPPFRRVYQQTDSQVISLALLVSFTDLTYSVSLLYDLTLKLIPFCCLNFVQDFPASGTDITDLVSAVSC
ncbi:hypothetical protein BaRGS_00008684, partial [Batillaria attramentaria]